MVARSWSLGRKDLRVCDFTFLGNLGPIPTWATSGASEEGPKVIAPQSKPALQRRTHQSHARRSLFSVHTHTCTGSSPPATRCKDKDAAIGSPVQTPCICVRSSQVLSSLSLSAYMDLPSPSSLPGSFYELQVTGRETETQLEVEGIQA